MNTKTVFIFFGIYLNSFVICENHTYKSNKKNKSMILQLLKIIKEDPNKEHTISKESHYGYIDYYDENTNEKNSYFNQLETYNEDENDDISPYVFDEYVNFRDYKELKIEYDTFVFKRDSKPLQDLFKEFMDINANDTLSFDGKNIKILYIIEELEHLLHDPDNLREFINLNGVTEIINKTLNSSIPKIRRESLNILGFCKQNKILRKDNTVQTNAIEMALHTLTTDSIKRVKLHAVSILKILILGGRQALSNQFFFTKIKGIEELTKIFSESNDLRLQLDILTLIYEILSEHAYDQNSASAKDCGFIKGNGNPLFKNKLMTNSWCVLLQKFVFNLTKQNARDSKAITECLVTMLFLVENCKVIFHNPELFVTLHNLSNHYKKYTEEYDSGVGGIMKPLPIDVNLYYLINKLHSNIIGIKTEF